MAFPRVCASREDALEALLHATSDEDPLVCHIALRMAEELGEREGVDERVMRRAPGRSSRTRRPRSAWRARSSSVAPATRRTASRGSSGRSPWESSARATARTWPPRSSSPASSGFESARPGLERRAFGGLLGLRRDPFAWHARVALARMGHERACREILGELGARDRDLRTLAVAAAGRARLSAARDRIASMRGREALADPDAVDEALAALAPADSRGAPRS